MHRKHRKFCRKTSNKNSIVWFSFLDFTLYQKLYRQYTFYDAYFCAHQLFDFSKIPNIQLFRATWQNNVAVLCTIFICIICRYQNTNQSYTHEYVFTNYCYYYQYQFYICIPFYSMFFFLFSSLFFFSIQENCAFVVLWIIGFITFMALEVVAMVYSNVLRDHVNRVSINKKRFFFIHYMFY